jgi:hypothetical protein
MHAIGRRPSVIIAATANNGTRATSEKQEKLLATHNFVSEKYSDRKQLLNYKTYVI